MLLTILLVAVTLLAEGVVGAVGVVIVSAASRMALAGIENHPLSQKVN